MSEFHDQTQIWEMLQLLINLQRNKKNLVKIYDYKLLHC